MLPIGDFWLVLYNPIFIGLRKHLVIGQEFSLLFIGKFSFSPIYIGHHLGGTFTGERA